MLVQFFCARQKDDLHSVKLVFVPAQKVLKRNYFAVKFLVWLKKFGLAQNTLGPVKGQGINVHFFSLLNDAIKLKLMYESLVLTSNCMIVKLKRLKHAKMQMI